MPLLKNDHVVANFAGVVASSGKSLPNKNNTAPFDEFDDLFKTATEQIEVTKGWRLEQNSNGYFRWRWQVKDSSGKSITYKTNSGKTAYKRGSKYVSKK